MVSLFPISISGLDELFLIKVFKDDEAELNISWGEWHDEDFFVLGSIEDSEHGTLLGNVSKGLNVIENYIQPVLNLITVSIDGHLVRHLLPIILEQKISSPLLIGKHLLQINQEFFDSPLHTVLLAVVSRPFLLLLLSVQPQEHAHTILD